VIIASADKNLGPVGVDTEDYIKMGLDHLLDPFTYTLLTKEQAVKDIDKLRVDIFSWTISHRQSLSDDAVNFIWKHLEDSAKDPLGYFYPLLIKLHKQPISGRPVCSDCGSLPHALGRWVDETLQPIVKDQALYLKNSAALQEELERMEMPPNASLFTYDAVTMYPSINTTQCIARLDYLSSPEISSKYGFSPKALLEALTLVMLNNSMRFALVADGVIRSE
jgi:hypothetical protein